MPCVEVIDDDLQRDDLSASFCALLLTVVDKCRPSCVCASVESRVEVNSAAMELQSLADKFLVGLCFQFAVYFSCLRGYWLLNSTWCLTLVQSEPRRPESLHSTTQGQHPSTSVVAGVCERFIRNQNTGQGSRSG